MNPQITTIFKGKGGVGGTTTTLFIAAAKALYRQAIANGVTIPDPSDLTPSQAFDILKQIFDLSPGAFQSPDETVEDRGRVLLIDADKGTRSIDRYTARRAQTHALTERLPFLVDKWTPDKGILTEFVADCYDKYEHPDEIIIDMGADPDYAAGAALMSTHIIMPVKPWEADYDTLVDLKATTENNARAFAYVLLTMVDVIGMGEAAIARRDIGNAPDDEQNPGFGMTVMRTEIKKRKDYRIPYATGSTPDPLWAYLLVLAELEGFPPIELDLNPGPAARTKG